MSKVRQRVYVSGPISNGALEENIRRAAEAGIALMRAGYAPLVPHLTCYMAGPKPEALPAGTAAKDWYDIDLPWVAVSDAVVRLLGYSVGADRETDLADKLGIPVYFSVEELVADPPPRRPAAKPGDPRFYELLAQIGDLHARKAADYGRGADPLANCRASAEWGVPPWVGVLIRMSDKMHRLKSFVQNGHLANEGVEDSLMDLASYALIAMILFREQEGGDADVEATRLPVGPAAA